MAHLEGREIKYIKERGFCVLSFKERRLVFTCSALSPSHKKGRQCKQTLLCGGSLRSVLSIVKIKRSSKEERAGSPNARPIIVYNLRNTLFNPLSSVRWAINDAGDPAFIIFKSHRLSFSFFFNHLIYFLKKESKSSSGRRTHQTVANFYLSQPVKGIPSRIISSMKC